MKTHESITVENPVSNFRVLIVRDWGWMMYVIRCCRLVQIEKELRGLLWKKEMVRGESDRPSLRWILMQWSFFRWELWSVFHLSPTSLQLQMQTSKGVLRGFFFFWRFYTNNSSGEIDQEMQDLLDGESNASGCDGSQEEDEQGDPKDRAPRESHRQPPSPGPALLLLVFVDCLLQWRSSSQTPCVCQVLLLPLPQFLYLYSHNSLLRSVFFLLFFSFFPISCSLCGFRFLLWWKRSN